MKSQRAVGKLLSYKQLLSINAAAYCFLIWTHLRKTVGFSVPRSSSSSESQIWISSVLGVKDKGDSVLAQLFISVVLATCGIPLCIFLLCLNPFMALPLKELNSSHWRVTWGLGVSLWFNSFWSPSPFPKGSKNKGEQNCLSALWLIGVAWNLLKLFSFGSLKTYLIPSQQSEVWTIFSFLLLFLVRSSRKD